MKPPPRNRSEIAIDRARSARANPSVAEEIEWKYLRNQRLGFKFRREYAVGPYRLDFYCSEARLAVEFDGEQHEIDRDARRDAYLAGLGVEVLRIPNRQFFVLDDQPYIDIFRLIQRRCEEITGRSVTPFEV